MSGDPMCVHGLYAVLCARCSPDIGMTPPTPEDEMRPEYDFRKGVRGKYFERYNAPPAPIEWCGPDCNGHAPPAPVCEKCGHQEHGIKVCLEKIEKRDGGMTFSMGCGCHTPAPVCDHTSPSGECLTGCAPPAPERMSERDLSYWANQACSCGGRGPDDADVCGVCLLYHEARRARKHELQLVDSGVALCLRVSAEQQRAEKAEADMSIWKTAAETYESKAREAEQFAKELYDDGIETAKRYKAEIDAETLAKEKSEAERDGAWKKYDRLTLDFAAKQEEVEHLTKAHAHQYEMTGLMLKRAEYLGRVIDNAPHAPDCAIPTGSDRRCDCWKSKVSAL